MYNRREKALLSFGQHQQTPEIIIKQKEKDNRAEQKTRRRRRGMAPCDIPFRNACYNWQNKKEFSDVGELVGERHHHSIQQWESLRITL
jgi:hypothetical protein